MTTWLAFCWRNKKWTGPTVLVLAAIATGLVVWQWPHISSGYLSTRDLLSRSLGFGFLLPLLWAATLTLAIWKMRFLLKARFINRWLAALFGTFALWGALAFFPADSGLLNEYTLGGHIGRSLKGSSDLIGVLRLAGATAFALVLAFPLGSRRFSKYSAEKLHLAAVTIRPHIARLFRKLGSMRAERARRRAERAQMKEEIALASLAAYNLKEDSSKPRITVQEAPVPRVVVNPRNASSASRSLEMGVVEAPPRPAARPAREPIVERELAEQPAPVAAKPERASKVAPLNLEIQTPRAPLRLEDWKLPPVTLLTEAPAESQEPGVDQEKTSSLIENTLSEYGIEVNVAEVKIGPVVTMFGLVPGWVRRSRQARAKAAEGEDAQANAGDRTRVRVDSIVAREKDLALALAAPSLRIEAPIPGASLVGIEVPNARPASVTLRGVMETVPYKSLLEKSKLALALGLGSGGEVAVADLARMPHLLIAGSTGSGKSVCINTVISCMIMQNSPWETRLLLIDPKRVELTPYNGIPHLIIPVVVEPEVAVQSLRGLVQEMLSRYKLLEEAGARNIASYNQDLPPEEQMPFIVVAVDELADLMMAAPHDIEHSIIRLAQLGRATGIHMIVATAAALGERGNGPDQGQLPRPHQLRRRLSDRLPHNTGRRGRRKAPWPGRHAVPTPGRAQTHANSGGVPVGHGYRRGGQALAGAARGLFLPPYPWRAVSLSRVVVAASRAGETTGTTSWRRHGRLQPVTTGCPHLSSRGGCASATRERPASWTSWRRKGS